MKRKNYIAGAIVLFVIGASVVALNFDEIFEDDGSIYYCSNDSKEYAESNGGILCPEGPGVVPLCPNAEPCECIDMDGDCDDGDDDWGYYSKEDNQEESNNTA